MIEHWKANIKAFVKEHERLITFLLLLVAAVLIVVALFGKPEHKAGALIYIVL